MADCSEFRELISGHVDGILSTQEEKALLTHLEDCASCRALLSSYQSINTTITESMVDVPDGFASCVMEKIRSIQADISGQTPPTEPLPHMPKQTESWYKAHRRGLHRTLAGVAAMAACFAIVYFVSPQLFTGTKTSDAASMSAALPELAPQMKIMDTQSAVPQASQSAGDESSESGAPDNKVTASVAPPAATESSTAGTSDSNYEVQKSDASVQSVAPETQMSLSAAAPRQTGIDGGGGGGGAPIPPDMGAESSFGLAMSYYAVITIKGTLPELLKDIEQLDNGDGTYNLVVTADVAKQLIKDGYQTVMEDESAENALVIYSPT